jgi:hypothetical protein
LYALRQARRKSQEVIRQKWLFYKERARQEARKEWSKLKHDPFFMLGLGLYWGEGSKTNRDLVLSNMDLDVIAVFKKWGERYTKVKSWGCRLTTSFPKRANKSFRTIAKKLGAGISFKKPTIIPRKKSHIRDWAVLNLRASKGTYAFYKVIEWLRLARI